MSDLRHDARAAGVAVLANYAQGQIAMGLGALACLIVGGSLRTSPEVASVYFPGSALYSLGDVMFLTMPLVVWMILRRHGRLHALELAAVTAVPMLVVIALSEAVAQNDLHWLVYAMYPAMSLSLLGYMSYRRDVFSDAR